MKQKCHENSYLHEVLCTSVTNRVLSWFDNFTASYYCISENSYLREFWFDRFMAKKCIRENVAKLISPRVLCTNITKRVLSWFDRFTAYYYCMNKKFKKTHIWVLCTKRVRLWTKMSENSYLREFCAQVSQIVLLADLTVLRLIFYSMSRNVRKLISPRVLCASVTNRVLSWFDFFSVITTVWAKMWEKSYLHEFCAKVSQNVFLADLTILRLNTIVWAKLSQSS